MIQITDVMIAIYTGGPKGYIDYDYPEFNRS